MLTIRPFQSTDDDYNAVVAIQNAVWPDQPETVAWWRYRDQIRNRQYFYHSLLVEADGQIVASGYCMETPWSYRPGKYALGITVHPAYERRGIGAMLYEHIINLLAARSLPPTLLVSNVREDKTQGVRFLQQRGFQQVMRSPISRLDLAGFDGSRFATVQHKVQAAGIELYTMPELAKIDLDHRQKIYELDWQCTLDEPLPDAPTKPSFEDYSKFFFDNPNFIPEACFIAVDKSEHGKSEHGKSEYVGLSNLFHNPGQPTTINTGFTAVLRTHRRRGIATALKLRAITYAQQHGYAAIKTGNEENNPMLAINLMLGFVPQPAWLDFQKIIQ
ncbi:MAG: GNAT family N-acetyltransferase [Caldilineaceae bacterium]